MSNGPPLWKRLLGVLFGAKRPTEPRRSPTARSTSVGQRPVSGSNLTISRVVVQARPTQSQPQPRDAPHTGQRYWVKANRPVVVRGHNIPGGMLYIGDGLTSISSPRSIEPALIDPGKPTNDRTPDDAGSSMTYWPSYAGVTPEARSAYLNWLSAGRGPGAYIGYVFLFFYGIERRVLFDAKHLPEAKDEVSALLAEVDRLRSLYSDNASFRSYASHFLTAASLEHFSRDLSLLPPPMENSGWDLPIEFKLGLGSILAGGQAVPPVWALSWLRVHPETRLRAPARRCPDEFNRLFMIRYEQQYGDGLTVRASGSGLQMQYHPASNSFGGNINIAVRDIPDVANLSDPPRALQRLSDEVSDALDAYSRWIGRTGGRAGLAAAALLPRELTPDRDSDAVRTMLKTIEGYLGIGDVAVIPTSALVALWLGTEDKGLGRRDACMVADLFERYGYGIEPDARYGGVSLAQHPGVAIFRQSGGAKAPDKNYVAAAAILQIGALLESAEGAITADAEARLLQHVEVFRVAPADRARLRAHMKWLLSETPQLTGVKPHTASLSPEQKTSAGQFLLAMVAAGGQVTPAKVRMLSRIYRLLGLPADQIHGQLQTLGVKVEPGPVTILPPDSSTGFSIPRTTPAKSALLILDQERIGAIMKSTDAVSELLAAVFDAPTETDIKEPALARLETDEPSVILLSGLDAAHSQFVMLLSQQPTWPRRELEAVADRLELLLGGAIETVNEAAYDRCGEPLVEGHEFLEVNTTAAKALLDASR